jgi:hypothetical protein
MVRQVGQISLSYHQPVTQQDLVGIVEALITESERKAQGIPLASCCGWFPRPPAIKFPVVRFLRIRGSKPPPERVMMAFAQKEIRNANHKTHASRKQVPLSLAWYVPPSHGSTTADGDAQGLDGAQIPGPDLGKSQDRSEFDVCRRWHIYSGLKRS